MDCAIVKIMSRIFPPIAAANAAQENERPDKRIKKNIFFNNLSSLNAYQHNIK